jgi:hypothetical protein
MSLSDGVMTVLDSGKSFEVGFSGDVREVIAVRTCGTPRAGSPVQIECGGLTVLGEILSADGIVAQVRIEHATRGAVTEWGESRSAAAAAR